MLRLAGVIGLLLSLAGPGAAQTYNAIKAHPTPEGDRTIAVVAGFQTATALNIMLTVNDPLGVRLVAISGNGVLLRSCMTVVCTHDWPVTAMKAGDNNVQALMTNVMGGQTLFNIFVRSPPSPIRRQFLLDDNGGRLLAQ